MTKLHLSLTPSSDMKFQTEMKLHQDMFGTPAVILLMGAFQVGGLATALALAALTGRSPEEIIPVSVASALGAWLALILYQNWTAHLVRRELSRSALRRAPISAILSRDGLSCGPETLPWSAVSATERWKDSTLLRFSRLDALLIPDADLPPGETPQTLAARIAEWKSA